MIEELPFDFPRASRRAELPDVLPVVVFGALAIAWPIMKANSIRPSRDACA
jgi:hypothetical protein